jgi:hypothetical protein
MTGLTYHPALPYPALLRERCQDPRQPAAKIARLQFLMLILISLTLIVADGSPGIRHLAIPAL